MIDRDKPPTARQIEAMVRAWAKAASLAEQRAAPLRSAADLKRQEGEAIRRDEREEWYRERGY